MTMTLGRLRGATPPRDRSPSGASAGVSCGERLRTGVVRLLASTLLVMAPTLAVGTEIYKTRDPSGTVTYTDIAPSDGSEVLELPPISIFSAPPLPDDALAAAEPEPLPGPMYEGLEVTSPTQDETIRDNNGVVSVSLSLSPNQLQAGHELVLMLDGSEVGRGKYLSASLTNVDRGTHSVSARVVDSDGSTVVASESVTFHLKQASRL